MAPKRFATVGLRAWFAYQALTDEHGREPSVRELERRAGLANKDLWRLIYDVYKRPSYEKMQQFAAALGTTPEWLAREEGPGPQVSWQTRPRPPIPPGMRKKTKSGSMKRVKEG